MTWKNTLKGEKSVGQSGLPGQGKHQKYSFIPYSIQNHNHIKIYELIFIPKNGNPERYFFNSHIQIE